MATNSLKAYRGYPPLGCEEEHVEQFLDRHFKGGKKSRFRRWHMQRMALNVWSYRGRHWLKPVDNLTADASTGTYRFREVWRQSGLAFSRPVDNLIAEGVDALVARLGRKEYVPDTRPDKHTPEIEQAAKLAKRIMLHDLEQMYWADKREAINFDVACPGTGIARSYWDETQTEQMVLSSPNAAECPGCGAKFASRNIPTSLAQRGIPTEDGGSAPFLHTETMTDVESDEINRPPEVRMNVCPTCPEPTELQDYAPSLEEAETGEDVLGRKMGFSVPKGEGLIEVVSWSDFFPENGGVGVEPDMCKLWAQETVRSMDWIASHEPEYADEIEPEDPRELLRNHPTLGDDAFSGGAPRGDDEIYGNHAMVQEVVIEPIPLPGLDKGRFFRRIGKHICKDTALTVPVETPDGETKEVPRIKYAAARQKRIPGEFWGRSRVDDARPINQRLNQLDAMDDDITEKGFPRIVLPSGAEFKEDQTHSGAFPIVETDASNTDPGWKVKDNVLFQQPVTGAAYQGKRQTLVQAIRDKLGVGEFEISGQNPQGVKTLGQLQILAEQVAMNRGTVERSLGRLMDTLFTHHLEITWALRREDTDFEVQNEAGDYEKQSYKGTDLLGQVAVHVEPKGDFDRTLFQQQAIREALNLPVPVYDLSSETARDEARELMGLPKINSDKSVQVERAEQAVSEFIRNGTIPIIDETLHDAPTWFQVLGKRWHGDDLMDLRREAKADPVIEQLAGWERKLDALIQADEKAKFIYEGRDPAEWDQIHQEALAQAQPAGPEAIAMIVPPPMAGQFLPAPIVQKIIIVFKQMLGPAWPMLPHEQVPTDGLTEEAKAVPQLDKLLKLYAIIQTYRKLQQSAQMGPVAAPDAAAQPMAGGAQPPGETPPPPPPGSGEASQMPVM